MAKRTVVRSLQGTFSNQQIRSDILFSSLYHNGAFSINIIDCERNLTRTVQVALRVLQQVALTNEVTIDFSFF